MSDDIVLLLEALAAAMAGDRARASDLLVKACPTEDDGWAAACGYTAMICAGVRVSKEVDAEARMTAFVMSDSDGGSDADDYAQILAAFIAAVGNDDYDGARRMFKSLPSTESKQRLLGDVLSIAVLVAKRHEQRKGSS